MRAKKYRQFTNVWLTLWVWCHFQESFLSLQARGREQLSWCTHDHEWMVQGIWITSQIHPEIYKQIYLLVKYGQMKWEKDGWDGWIKWMDGFKPEHLSFHPSFYTCLLRLNFLIFATSAAEKLGATSFVMTWTLLAINTVLKYNRHQLLIYPISLFLHSHTGPN